MPPGNKRKRKEGQYNQKIKKNDHLFVCALTKVVYDTNIVNTCMIEFPHAIVGAAIATKIGNPALALPLALASHFALDLVPHWNPHLNKEIKEHGYITKKTKWIIGIDVVASLAAGLYIASLALPDTHKAVIVVLGAFFGVLPDVAEAPFFFWGSKNKFLKNLVSFQSKLQFNIPIIPGLISQALVTAATLWWVLH